MGGTRIKGCLPTPSIVVSMQPEVFQASIALGRSALSFRRIRRQPPRFRGRSVWVMKKGAGLNQMCDQNRVQQSGRR